MQILQNIPLKDHSNYKIGGVAKYFLSISSKEDLIKGVKEFRSKNANGNIFILGGGTNVLIPDKGIEGLVILNELKGITVEGDLVKSESGVLFSDLVNFSIENSMSGLEWAGGLPGTVGGAVRGNAGAFGGETKDNVLRVTSINLKTFEEKTREKEDLNFGYRISTFKNGSGKSDFILEAYFKLTPGNKENIRSLVQEKIDFREKKHPMDFPNIGSTFKNIPIGEVLPQVLEQFKNSVKNDPMPILPVAKILSVAGLKGKTIGGAKVSEKHPNFIVNIGGAKAADVLALIDFEKIEIKEKFGLELEEEIMVL